VFLLQRVQARRSTLMGKGVTGLAPAAKVVVTRKVATSAMAKVNDPPGPTLVMHLRTC